MKKIFKLILLIMILIIAEDLYGQHFDTAKVVLGFKSLIYFDQNFGERRYQTDSLIISYTIKKDKSDFCFLNKFPEYQLRDWLFILRITNKNVGTKLTGTDSSLILKNGKLFCCAYIVAYNIRTETYYRLNGFRQNDAKCFFTDIKIDLPKTIRLPTVENLDIKCLYSNRKNKKDTRERCMISCEIRDYRIFHITE